MLAGGGFLTGIVAFAVLGNLAVLGGVDVQGSVVTQTVLNVIALQGIGFLVASLVFLRVRDRFDLVSVRRPTVRDAGYAVGGVFVLFAGLILLNAVYTALGIETGTQTIVEQSLDTPTLALYSIPFSYLLVGPGEELLFRGAIQGILRESYGVVPAIVVASVVFAAAHGLGITGTPTEIVASLSVIFMLSLVFGAVYERTGNILVPVFIHGTYNAFTFLSLYLRGTGAV
ncbi:CPBP family intramembrane glutamic endopeptidase [Halosegnis marinus]